MPRSASVRARKQVRCVAGVACALCVTAFPALVFALPPAYRVLPPPEEKDPLSGPWVFWTARVSTGIGAYVRPEVGPAFDLDITGGGMLCFDMRSIYPHGVMVAPEASYSFSSHPRTGGNFAAIGVGPVWYPTQRIGIGWAPKLVAGATHEGAAIGMRNMAVLMLGDYGEIQIEVGHQWLHVAGEEQHEIRTLLGFDVIRFLQTIPW